MSSSSALLDELDSTIATLESLDSIDLPLVDVVGGALSAEEDLVLLLQAVLESGTDAGYIRVRNWHR